MINQHEDEKNLSLGEKKDILKVKKGGKKIRAIGQTMGITNRYNLECPEKKETTAVLIKRHITGWPRKTTAVDVKDI